MVLPQMPSVLPPNTLGAASWVTFSQLFKPATPPAAAILAFGPFLPLYWHTFLPSFLFLATMSQQFHAWSHMKKSELHPVVVALQVCGAVLIVV